MAADENVLGALHSKVAEVLTNLLDGTELPTGETDEAGNEITQRMDPSAAVLTSAIQFLKNNNITCAPAENNALGALADKIAQREQRRKEKRTPLAPADLSTVAADTAFMMGRAN